MPSIRLALVYDLSQAAPSQQLCQQESDGIGAWHRLQSITGGAEEVGPQEEAPKEPENWCPWGSGAAEAAMSGK